jgi:glycosyltransferase involved in cell wall biosynthesis
MGEASRKRALERFTVERMIKGYEEIYRAVTTE